MRFSTVFLQMGHPSIWSPQYWHTPWPQRNTIFLMRSKQTGHMVCSLISWSCCCSFCTSNKFTFCSDSAGLAVEATVELLASAAMVALLGALTFVFAIRLLWCMLLFRLLYVDWEVDDDDGVTITLNLLFELQLFMLMLCPLWLVPCSICASFLCSSILWTTFDTVPVDTQQTLNGTIWSMAVLHCTHFFMIGAQWLHATICPQGLKNTDAFRSEQTRQSSICWIRNIEHSGTKWKLLWKS